jgi:hypothetical protein
MGIEILCDLRNRFGVARDQGARPTCLAFAASDAHAALRNPWSPLSCEYAFYHAQQRDGRSVHSGATLSTMLTVLKLDGQPLEADWPYLAALPVDLGLYLPPANITLFRRNGERTHDGVKEILKLLDTKQPTLILMMISDSFYSPDPAGVVRAPAGEAPDPNRRHAVVAAGHGQIDGAPAILVRNSWGPDWGISGYAWLPVSFLEPRLTHVALLKEEMDVHT